MHEKFQNCTNFHQYHVKHLPCLGLYVKKIVHLPDKNKSIMKKVILSVMVAGLFFASCAQDKTTTTTPVATDVVNVEGSNVADAQEDLNASLISAQEEVNKAQEELNEAQAAGNTQLVGSIQARIDSLNQVIQDIQSRAGSAIRDVHGASHNAGDVLDSHVDAAEDQLDRVESQAQDLRDGVNR